MANMKLIGAKFTKVNAERNPDFSGKLSMDTNIKITELDRVKDSKDAVKISYLFGIDYGELGKISIEGSLFVTTDSKTVKELIKLWKDKKVDTPEMIAITNLIIQKASIRAFELEEELGLPIHIKLPSLSIKKD